VAKLDFLYFEKAVEDAIPRVNVNSIGHLFLSLKYSALTNSTNK